MCPVQSVTYVSGRSFHFFSLQPPVKKVVASSIFLLGVCWYQRPTG